MRASFSALFVLLAACGSTPNEAAPAAAPPADVDPPRGPSARNEARTADAPAARPSGPREVTIGASGDVLIHNKVQRSAGDFEAEGGYDHVFSGLREVVDENEVAFLNLETPLAMYNPPASSDPPILGAPAVVAQALARAGIDVVSVANNHSFDQGMVGLEDTLDALAAAQIGAVGAAPNENDAAGPLQIERDGVRIALLAFTERVNRGPGTTGRRPIHPSRFAREDAIARVREARADADLVVVSIHWSHDFYREPMAQQRTTARALVDAGADLILGHGPHVLQEVERFESPRGDAVCAYSLGNIISNQGLRYRIGRPVPPEDHPALASPFTRDSVWLRVRFAVDRGRVSIRSLTGVPLWTHNNHLRTLVGDTHRLDIHVVPLASAGEDVVAARRREIVGILGDAVEVAP